MKFARPAPSNRLPLALGVLALGVLTFAVASAGAAQAHPAIQTPSCPARDFAGFFKAFSDSQDVQRAFTGASVDFTEIDANAQPEPREVTVNRPLAAIQFPVIPTTSEQRRNGLEMTTSRTEDGMMRVRLEKPDTDYQLVYIFKTHADCWTLYAKADNSL